MVDWWNTDYLIRRPMTVSKSGGLPLLIGYPVFVYFDYSNILNSGRIRTDFGDVEVIYNDPVTGVNTVVGKAVSIQDLNMIVQFNLVKDVDETDSNYWLYYTNPQLNNIPVDPPYTSAEFAIDTSVNGLGLTFTRPAEDWTGNVSLQAGAKAAFSFTGKSVRLTVEKGPNRGIFLLTVDNDPPITIDTYNTVSANQVVYTTTTLAVKQHYLRINATGDKNPSASSSGVHIVSFQYSQFTPATVGAEELNPNLVPIRIIVGS